MLIAARVMQGIGAAAMLPCSLILINHAAAGHPRRRAQAVGWWTAAGGITIAAGPILGGLLLGITGWRSIFLVNLPLCLLAGWLVFGTAETERLRGEHHFDLLGQVLGIVALGAITAAVIEAKPLGLGNPLVLGLAAGGIGAAVGFVYHEQRTRAPMLPLSLFHSPAFSGAVLYGAIVNLTYYGAVFVLSLYLQRVLGYSPIIAGLAFLPLTATFFGINILSGWWVGHSGSRMPMIVGGLIDAGGFALLGWVVSTTTPYAFLLPAFLLLPGGMGLGVPAMTTAVLASVAHERAGTASAVLNAARQAAGAIGVALFGALAGDAPAHIVTGLRASTLIAIALLVIGAIIAGATIGRTAKKGATHDRRNLDGGSGGPDRGSDARHDARGHVRRPRS
jgi:DHA2 family methylenomycin A resistance protein-like MFS transporter